MSSTKSLVRWMAAAIVMIAAYALSPSAALAHPGHGEAAAVSISVSGDASQAGEQGLIEVSSPESDLENSPLQSAAIPDRDPQTPCTDFCCLMAGASCCGAAVACGPPGSAAGLGAGQRFAPPQDSVPAGLSAQALQEPPRVQL